MFKKHHELHTAMLFLRLFFNIQGWKDDKTKENLLKLLYTSILVDINK